MELATLEGPTKGRVTVGNSANREAGHQTGLLTTAKINLLFVVDQLVAPGGAERMLLKTIQGLPSDRFECQLLTFRYDPEIDIFRKPPCPLYVFPLRRTYDLNAVKIAFQIRRLIRERKISIVHTFHETSDLFGGLIAKMSGCPALISSRRDMGHLRSSKHRIGYRVLNRLFDRILAVSEQVRRRCIETEAVKADKVITLHNGIDFGKMDEKRDGQCRTLLGIDERVPLITALGNIRRIKGFDVLLQAAQRVVEHYPDSVFLIVGKTMEKDCLEELSQLTCSLNLTRNIKFVGSTEDVLSILKTSNIFCLPSRSEGFSNALLEAMACALPCIATDVGGNCEAIIDGVNGCLVPPESPELIAARILEILRSPALAQNLGKAARKTVEQKFTFDRMISKLVRVYDDVVDSKSL